MVAQVPDEFDLLVKRLTERMPDRLQEEPDPRSRAILFGFPAQLSAIRKPIVEFLNRIFEPTRYQTTRDAARLLLHVRHAGRHADRPGDRRAATQLRRREFRRGRAIPASGKSFFLHDLLTKVIFGEAGWVSTNMAAVRRALRPAHGDVRADRRWRRPACSACGG